MNSIRESSKYVSSDKKNDDYNNNTIDNDNDNIKMNGNGNGNGNHQGKENGNQVPPSASSLLSPSPSPSSSSLAPLLTFQARRMGPNCPFGNDEISFQLYPGGCIHLKGPSGRGKTSLAMALANLPGHNDSVLFQRLDIQITKLEWNHNNNNNNNNISAGVLFQQTTLLDDLTVAGNLKVALDQQQKQKQQKNKKNNKETKNNNHDSTTTTDEQSQSQSQQQKIMKQLLDAVGLDYARDASKRPTELSGGMGRRASLAMQLAQQKQVIVLDEPFTGLDYTSAVSVAKELVHLRKTHQTAFVLISHEPHLTNIVMMNNNENNDNNNNDNDNIKYQNETITLLPPPKKEEQGPKSMKSSSSSSSSSLLFGTTFQGRFMERFMDYTLWSLPLIITAFAACGLAVSMMNGDLLQRIDINNQVLDLIDTEVRPLIKLLTGEEATKLQMMGIKFKVKSMLNQTIPPAKAKLYVIGLTKLFVLEVGPLLTALLLCGRIGGSYAGKVGMMQATAQNKLLQTMNINPQIWTFVPSILAAIIAGPILTIIGTFISLYFGSIVGPKYYGIGTTENFWKDFYDTIFPILRLQSFEPLWMINNNEEQGEHDGNSTLSTIRLLWNAVTSPKLFQVSYNKHVRSSSFFASTHTPKSKNNNKFSPSLYDFVIEVSTYPPIFHILKSTVFIFIIMMTAEIVSRRQPNLTPRGVPSVITFSVVLAGLLVILADWAFSQLWLLRY